LSLLKQRSRSSRLSIAPATTASTIGIDPELSSFPGVATDSENHPGNYRHRIAT
jgi:hypothetical protein